MHTPSFATPRPPQESRRGSLARTLASRAAAALVLLAGAAMIASALAGTSRTDTTVFRVGLAVALIGSTLWVFAQTRIGQREIDRARDHGYDAGYDAGFADASSLRRETIRLVPLHGVALAGDGPVEQLRQ